MTWRAWHRNEVCLISSLAGLVFGYRDLCLVVGARALLIFEESSWSAWSGANQSRAVERLNGAVFHSS